MEKNKINFTFKKAEIYKNILEFSNYANIAINGLIGKSYFMDFKEQLFLKYGSENLPGELLREELFNSSQGSNIK